MVMVSSNISSSDILHEISLEKFCHADLDDHVNDDPYDPMWSQLDIPQDNLEDIELFPNFGDGFMSLPDQIFTLTPAGSVDSPDNRDWYEFYSMDSTSTNPDSQNKIFVDEVCDNQSTSTIYDQNHSQSVEVSDILQSQVCDNQSRLTNHGKQVEVCDDQSKSTYGNHCNNTVEVRDSQSNRTCENHSKHVEVFDSYQSNVCDNQSKLTGYSTMFYGQELYGFQRKKMRSERVFPLRSTGPTENSKRKCTHCETESTPQWRMGPKGPNTLCNACGVRHQTGRLLPEYRPAASPTFDVSKHSNFHKRILKRKAI